jgi:hypothetical protein
MFNKVYIGAAKQGWDVYGIKNNKYYVAACKYRGDNNSKCFVGHLIPDDKYTVKLERYTVHDSQIYQIANFNPKLSYFAGELQDVHDCSYERKSNLKDDIEEFAKSKNLTIPNVEKWED